MTTAIAPPEVLAFDNAPEALRALFTDGLLRDLVSISTRESIVGSANRVTVVEVNSLPVAAWSTGERVLWDFACSLAGARVEYTLGNLMDFFKGSYQAELCAAAFAAVMGVGE
jgi:hypothetical protein